MDNRSNAIAWWNSLQSDIKILITLHEHNKSSSIEGINLTGREIENIWQQLQTK